MVMSDNSKQTMNKQEKEQQHERHEGAVLLVDSSKAKRRTERPRAVKDSTEESSVDWRDKALRLHAEMDNYRKRQERRAQEEIQREKARLLGRFLEVADDLEYALHHIKPGDPTHQGVQMAYNKILNILLREGVERIFALGRRFDPHVHEAVEVVPGDEDQRDDLQVKEVLSPGYRFGDQVLRPAKVVVAKKEH